MGVFNSNWVDTHNGMYALHTISADEMAQPAHMVHHLLVCMKGFQAIDHVARSWRESPEGDTVSLMLKPQRLHGSMMIAHL